MTFLDMDLDHESRKMTDGYRLLTVREVAKIVGIGIPTVWKWTAAHEFPAPLRLSTKATRWRSDEIAEWIESRPRSASAA